jgi:hypothetical protein
MNSLATPLLRAALVVLLLGSLGAQILLPLFASQQATTFPEVAGLVVPYSVIGILVIACGQVALVVVWKLLSLVNSGAIFTRRALRWVDVITACGAVATVLSAVVMIHLLATVGGPGVIILILLACLAAGSAFVLLMVVMRGLLETAIADRTELDEVI